MNSKRKIFLIIAFLFFYLTANAWSGETNKLEIHSPSWSLGTYMNLKYNYLSWYIDYRTKDFMFDKKMAVHIRYEGFRISDYVIAEVNRFKMEADYSLKIDRKKDYTRIFSLRAGWYLFYDLTESSHDTAGFGFAGLIGADLTYVLGRHSLKGESTLSFYRDGQWLEVTAGYQFALTDSFKLNFKINSVLAYTYNGKSSAGFFPYLFVKFVL